MALPQYIPRYTVADYSSWPGDWELWNGVAVAMSPSAGAEHQRLVGALYRKFDDAVRSGDCRHCLVYFELDWIVDESTVLRPDLLIVCNYRPHKFVEQTPALVVEVLSQSTRQRDLLYKRALYQDCGVGHYLLVDPEHRTCELLSLEDGEFRAHPGGLIHLSDGCELDLNLSDLFD